MQEALFYRDVSYIVIIPEGFTESFKNNGNIKIGKMQVKDTNTGMYIDIEINKYFNSLELYSKYGDENTNYIDTVLSNSDIKSNAIIQDGTNKKSTINAMDFYFLFSAYILLAVIPFSVSTFIITFNKKEIKDRTHCSPLTNKKINMQILIGILSYCLIILLTLVISAACIYPTDFFTLRGFFHSLNMFVYIMVCMALSFTIGNMVKSSIALNGAINVISLSFCFLGGIFVSQEILGKTVSMVGSFTPTYWFAKASNEIALTTNYSGNSLNQILIYMGIVLGFAIAFFAIGLVTTKQKRNNK